MKSAYRFSHFCTLSASIVLFFACGGLQAESSHGAKSRTGASRQEEVSKSADFAQQVIERINSEREHAGILPLQRQDNITQSANWMAQDLSEQCYFSHTDSKNRDFVARLTDFQYLRYRMVAENIAVGQKTPAEVVDAWMNSPGHRANILNPELTETGVAYCPPTRNNPCGYWVQDFGSRRDIFPVVINRGAERSNTAEVKLFLHGKNWANWQRFSSDGVTWSDWEPFQTTRNWSLEPGSGKRTVYVELRRGDQCRRAEASIFLQSPASGERTSTSR